jgi:hypothetical protein
MACLLWSASTALVKDEIVAKGESADYVSKNQVSAVSFVEAGEADRS